MAIWNFLFITLWRCKITKTQKAEVILLMEEAVKPFLEKYVSWSNVIIWNTQLFTSILTISICILLYYLPRINTKRYPLFLLNMQPFPFCWKEGSQLCSRIPFSIICLHGSFRSNLNPSSKVGHKIYALLITSQHLSTVVVINIFD